VRSRPPQPVAEFVLQANAVIAHDVEAQLSRITAPTQITFGSHDMVTSTRFAKPLKEKIRNSELVIFEQCAHAPNFEKVDEFNQRTLAFLQGHKSVGATASL
jgi:pimeloyl-ACP methyl ester carboxylesterase